MLKWLAKSSAEKPVDPKWPAVEYFQNLFPRTTLEEITYALLTTLLSSFNKYLKLGVLNAEDVRKMLQTDCDIQKYLKAEYQNTFRDATIYNKSKLKLLEISRLIDFVKENVWKKSKMVLPQIIDPEMKALFEVAFRERNKLIPVIFHKMPDSIAAVRFHL